MTLMGGVALEAEEKPKEAEANAGEKPARAPVKCAVIGCGIQGREILNTLARQPNALVTAVCDNYRPFLKRAKEAAPKAQTFEDYPNVLPPQDVPAGPGSPPPPLHTHNPPPRPPAPT